MSMKDQLPDKVYNCISRYMAVAREIDNLVAFSVTKISVLNNDNIVDTYQIDTIIGRNRISFQIDYDAKSCDGWWFNVY